LYFLLSAMVSPRGWFSALYPMLALLKGQPVK
jgi:hypothetical protein